jgi:hypothetical protein
MARRTQLAIGFGAVLVLTLVATVAFGAWAWTWSDEFANQVAAVTAVFATGTFVLAVVAGVIALAAYIASIQPPDLDVALEVPFAKPNELEFFADHANKGPVDYAKVLGPRELLIRIHNRSRFSARNPAYRVELKGLAGMFPARGDNWSMLRYAASGAVLAQWDGGADLMIHGRWSRDVHLSLHDTVDLETDHEVVIEVVAEGFNRSSRFPVRVLEPAEYRRRHPDAAALITAALGFDPV